jgi:probable HAF family extracellular repeat protein
VVHGISADGRTIIGYDTDGDTAGYANVTAYRIDDGALTPLEFQAANHMDSAPSGSPSADGHVLAGRIMHVPGSYRACYWSGTTLVPLTNLAGGADYSQGYNTSADGSVIVGVCGSPSSNGGAFTGEACRWINGQPAGLGDLPGGTFSGIAIACNHDGSVIVGFSETANGARAFLWDAVHGMRDLKSVLESDCGLALGAWELTAANAITPDGSLIVGSGRDPSGNVQGWLARLQCSTTWTFCTAGTTSHGCAASISGTGTPSASSSSGFVLSATNVEGDKQGLFFYGLSGSFTVPWGAGTSVLCVKSPTQRMPVTASGGTSGACDGVLASDWNAFRAAHPTALGSPFLGGELVAVQAWFRDPPSAKTTSLSNALSFLVCP